MPDFVKPSGVFSPFGRNEFLRSVDPKPQTESYTLAKDTVTAQTIDGQPNQKILQPGTALAKITSGPNAGKVGPFQPAGTSEQDTLTKSGTWTGVGGTYRLGSTGGSDFVDVAFDATASQIAAAVGTLDAYEDFVVSGTGGPLGTTPVVLTFTGDEGDNVPNVTFDPANLTGGTTPSATVTQSQASSAGSTDGRGVLANLVGLDLTFLPWQLMDRDVEVSVVTDATAVQAWCFEYDAAGALVALSNTTADAMRGLKRLDIKFA
jgi:hypothetical protein